MRGRDELTSALNSVGLEALGGFHITPQDDLPDGYKSLVLLGPSAKDFWPTFRASAEYNDAAPDPIDRWSFRTITALAQDHDAHALFPFGQTPPLPFISWALRTGRCHISAAHLLIHNQAGLWVSFRGALLVRQPLDFGPNSASPCDQCVAKPCLDACPAMAITAAGYDVAACHDLLDRPLGATCMSGGCLVRQSCPISQKFGRNPDQSALHMRSFHP